MQRYLLFLYALCAYLSAMLSLALLILWVYPWPFMPVNIDTKAGGKAAFFVDVALLVLFGLQHSVMARPAFKKAVFGRACPHRCVPRPIPCFPRCASS